MSSEEINRNNIINILKDELVKEENQLYSSFILHLIKTIESSKKRKRSAAHIRKRRKISGAYTSNTYGIFAE